MRGARIVLMIGALALAGAAVAAGALNPASPARHCKAGSTSATIGGKHVCLRAGARCTKSVDRQYHRYRFHCHSGRLARFPARPAPSPAAPPTLPEPPAPAGALVDIGGYRLHLECVGTAAPTVVIETGSPATRLNYRKVQYALASEYRVCTYDRPGTTVPVPSASDPRPASVPPTSETFARELHTLLANAGVPGPYVLAGTSFGGFLISTFTARYPADVAGAAYIDAYAPGSVDSWRNELLRGFEPYDVGADVDRLRTLDFGSRPVVVLSTTLAGEISDFRRRARNLVVAQASFGHLVFVEAPGLAFEAIRVATAAARAGAPLPPCAQTSLPRIGARCVP